MSWIVPLVLGKAFMVLAWVVDAWCLLVGPWNRRHRRTGRGR